MTLDYRDIHETIMDVTKCIQLLADMRAVCANPDSTIYIETTLLKILKPAPFQSPWRKKYSDMADFHIANLSKYLYLWSESNYQNYDIYDKLCDAYICAKRAYLNKSHYF